MAHSQTQDIILLMSLILVIYNSDKISLDQGMRYRRLSIIMTNQRPVFRSRDQLGPITSLLQHQHSGLAALQTFRQPSVYPNTAFCDQSEASIQVTWSTWTNHEQYSLLWSIHEELKPRAAQSIIKYFDFKVSQEGTKSRHWSSGLC